MRFTAEAIVVLPQNHSDMQPVAQLTTVSTNEGIWFALVQTAMLFSRQFWNVTV